MGYHRHKRPARAQSGSAAAESQRHSLAAAHPPGGDVLVCLADGLTNNEIAAHLGITSGTVRIYLQTIFQKLGVTNRTQAVLRYLGRSEEGVRV
ncbi:helix-turn-helix domain-containing protein [Synechococcus sp. CBW1107]|uniref:helix-turn-helix domain-containing protein n=1 Tax=Synechococcus sp. CBW1107 TaxID=2789857 RepID=UPI003A0FDA3F